jgi:hypothetical protein
MSPGPIWGALPSLKELDAKTTRRIVIFMVGYSALFGSDKLGWEGIIDKETKHNIYDFVEKRLQEGKRKDAIDQLKLEYPKVDTMILESPEHDHNYKLVDYSADQG